MHTLAPVCIEHVECDGAPCPGFWVLNMWSCICSLSSCPCGWLPGDEEDHFYPPLVSYLNMLEDSDPPDMCQGFLVAILLPLGKATPHCDPLLSNGVVMIIISARIVNFQCDQSNIKLAFLPSLLGNYLRAMRQMRGKNTNFNFAKQERPETWNHLQMEVSSQ